MYISPETAAVLAVFDIRADALTDDPTGIVLERLASELARHEADAKAAAQALITKLEAAAAGNQLVCALASSTDVRRHDEAYHGIAALRTPLHAAVVAWKRAHGVTREATR